MTKEMQSLALVTASVIASLISAPSQLLLLLLLYLHLLRRFQERWEPKKDKAPEEARRVVEEELAKLGEAREEGKGAREGAGGGCDAGKQRQTRRDHARRVVEEEPGKAR